MQYGRSIKSVSGRATFHLEDAEGALRLYLPNDEVERDVCFESDLPRRLCDFLGITDPVAPGVIGSVIRKDKPTVIRKILENAGVGQVDCDFAALDEKLGASKDEFGVKTLVEPTSDSRLVSSSPTLRQSTPSGRPKRQEKQSNDTDAEDVRTEAILHSSYQVPQRDPQEIAHEHVLDQAINVAKTRIRSGVFESTGVSVPGLGAIEALPPETIQEAFATRSQERDFKVGAAGELYMFEYLTGLDLPVFDLRNWKSAIRDRVNIHVNHRDLEKDNDRTAIADIEYFDDSSTFTDFLIQKGHLAQEIWKSKTPFYHIEVKTTVSSNWQELFYISKAQERHVSMLI